MLKQLKTDIPSKIFPVLFQTMFFLSFLKFHWDGGGGRGGGGRRRGFKNIKTRRPDITSSILIILVEELR